jgi:hypothetical protein
MMCHIYECPNCHKVSAQLLSFQYQDVWRWGVDIYDCAECGKRMVVETEKDEVKKAHQYNGTREELLWRFFKRMLSSLGHTDLDYKAMRNYSIKLELYQKGIERTKRKRSKEAK